MNDLKQAQREAESAAIFTGIETFKKKIAKASKGGTFGETCVGAAVLNRHWPRLRDAVAETIEWAMEHAAVRGFIIERLAMVEPEVTAFMTLRVLMNELAKRDKTRADLSAALGKAFTEELVHLSMRSANKRAYQYWQERADKATNQTTRDRCMDKLKSLFDRGSLPALSNEERACVGMVLVDICREKLGIVTQDLRKSGRSQWAKPYVSLTPQFRREIESLADHMADCFPKYKPMLCRPDAWLGVYDGGFVGELKERNTLVRTGRTHYLEELNTNKDRLDVVTTAVNAIQDTPWRINKRVFSVLDKARTFHNGVYRLPWPDDKQIPPPPPGAEVKGSRERQKYAFAIQEVSDFNRQNAGHRTALAFTLSTARDLLDTDEFFFPHNLDWRGRVYPITSYLSPQGSDTQRGLLEFARGRPLGTDAAAGWLAVHGSGCYGYDKVSFEDRLQWIKEHEEDIRAVVSDPFANIFWTEADSPYMFLAFCYEWVGYLEHGLAHVSHLPVSMDGSCNGLQNFAAMLRDDYTARSVNLAPSDKPNDIYAQVAVVVAKAVADKATNFGGHSTKQLFELARKRTGEEINVKETDQDKLTETRDMWETLCARWIDGQINRTLVKRPVMTYPYAVSRFGMGEQLTGTLFEMHRDGKIKVPYEYIKKIGTMLTPLVYYAVRREVRAAAIVMDWLKHVASVVGKANCAVVWSSPAGFPCVQEYTKSRKKWVHTQYGKQKIRQMVMVPMEDIDIKRQASAIAPNFVHSMDAAHLMLTVNACLEEGMSDFHFIHDSYGCHASEAPRLARILREQFVEMYSVNRLEKFRNDLKPFLPLEVWESIEEPPEQGDFDLSQVMNSRFFFA